TILTEHKKRIDEQIKSEKKKVENLKSYLLHNMQQLQVKSVKDPLINVSLRNSTSLVFTNEDKIPKEWIKVKTEVKPDKEGFKKWYKS
ncbi:siphovirus Gp157 family protein, partial [Staphylococcus capitis]|uniref:siphovirus Gp157 family protein n=1 Tax=Staphylococcus capitis TaxID=29388 RepID=UPI00066D4372